MSTWIKNRFRDAEHGRQTLVVSSAVIGAIGFFIIAWALTMATQAGVISFR
jgi:hypothetical protein